MSLLTVIQEVCGVRGMPVPTTILGAPNEQVLQLLRLLEQEGRDVSKRGAWEGLTFEAAHTTLATEDQGAIATIASNGFNYIKNQTIWDRTDRLPILGPMRADDWQAMKAVVSTGPRYRFRIRGGKLLVNPAPPAGHVWRFEYVSRNWIIDVNGLVYKRRFSADSDVMLLPEELLQAGLEWRWLRAKGFDYMEEFRTYEMQVKDALGRDGGKPVLHLDEPTWRGPTPGIMIPGGTWSV